MAGNRSAYAVPRSNAVTALTLIAEYDWNTMPGDSTQSRLYHTVLHLQALAREALAE